MANETGLLDLFGNISILGISTEQPLNSTLLDDCNDPYCTTLEHSRFIIQRILVPLVMVIGVIGNSITIAILTRRHMQSSTNCYLTALALSDLLYLVFAFSLSLRHLPGMTHKSYLFYWHYYRSALWLTDASSSTSIWLTVVFTVERYIAVCYPMKGKVLCTHSRAKRIIFAVYFACFALTVTTPFEWKIMPDPTSNGTHLVLENSSLGSNETYKKVFYWFTAVTFILIPLTLLAIFNSFLIVAVKHGRKLRRQMTQKKALRDNSSAQQEQKITIMLIAVVLLALCCQMPTAIYLMYSSFREAAKPKSIEHYVTRILGNVFNFLTTLNAASNFILYCVMSDRYRKTFLETFCKKRMDSTMETSMVSGTSYVGMSVQNSFKVINTPSVNKPSNNNKKRPSGAQSYIDPDEHQVGQRLGESAIRTHITYRSPSPRGEHGRFKRKSNPEPDINDPLIVRIESADFNNGT